eukprot:TRINITY_DN6324_c0_g1_i1.p1 TRINITY_DN6324_c0_g1~~TRINITY_DN6324_c0_g1_i1.p1  ORF type:complete len:257 (-),score=32.51 TRINITY_DN6324_c0_g1_i1:65-835(-)
MASRRILSMPVWNREDEKFTGMIDMEDMVHLATKQDFDDIFSSKPVGDVMNMSQSDVYYPVCLDESLYNAVEIFTRGIHRVPVVNDKGQLVNIISQSTVVELLHRKADGVATYLDSTIEELRLGNEEPLTVNARDSVSTAFTKMAESSINALAIVQDDSTLAGNISCADLRGLTLEHFARLQSSVLDFVKEQSHQKQLYTCAKNNTLWEAITELAVSHVHRLWIVDEANKPIGLVSLTDIMKAILRSLSHRHQHHH